MLQVAGPKITKSMSNYFKGKSVDAGMKEF